MEIFLLEDDPSTANLVKKHLGREFSILHYSDIESAKKALKNTQSRVYILDESLPDGNGLDLCLNIRETFQYKVFIFIFTSSNELPKKLQAYQFGADDYILKPVNMLELAAKLKNVFMRISNEEGSFQHCDLYFNTTQLEAYFIQDNQKDPLELTPKEFLILSFMAQNSGDVLSREQIIQHVWGELTHISDRTVDQHITHLRKKTSHSIILLESVRGEGYKLITKK